MLVPSLFSNNFFDDFFNFDEPVYRNFPEPEKVLYGHRANRVMAADVKEQENGYEVSMDLPGFKKEDIKAELKDGCLTISASRDVNKDEKNEEGKYLRRERYSGTVSRSFYVGKTLTEEDIKAKFEDGILTLTIPKEDQKKIDEKKFIAIG